MATHLDYVKKKTNGKKPVSNFPKNRGELEGWWQRGDDWSTRPAGEVTTSPHARYLKNRKTAEEQKRLDEEKIRQAWAQGSAVSRRGGSARPATKQTK